jgi:FtsP/CotA-like multicopper oxidase with cupredoxin domain
MRCLRQSVNPEVDLPYISWIRRSLGRMALNARVFLKDDQRATIKRAMKAQRIQPGQIDSQVAPLPGDRREFLRSASLAAGAMLCETWQPAFARAQSGPESKPDYRIEIAEIEWELAPKKKIRTAAYDSQIPGKLLRVTEGKPVAIEIVNHLDRAEIVHWHGQWIPVEADGSMEEGSPMIPAGDTALVRFTPRPAGLHWYHTHAMAERDLYTGQFGVLHVDPPSNPARYDQEQFIVLHDWEPYYSPSDDGSLMVMYGCGSINGRMLGHDAPIQVREGQRVLFHILNASATEPHWITLPGHRFQVLALDGAPVATEAKVEALRLGPAERISALVTMDTPGVFVLGEPRDEFRNAGMGTVIEYAGRTGKPQVSPPTKLQWDYRVFGDPTPVVHTPDVTIPLVFTSRFKGHGALDQWMINGKSWPEGDPILLREGLRHRLVFINKSVDDHPIHLHRHNFQLVSIHGAPTSGVRKDVVIVEAGTTVEADLLATNPGNTLFHCHQQDHMDSGFMALFRYA